MHSVPKNKNLGPVEQRPSNRRWLDAFKTAIQLAYQMNQLLFVHVKGANNKLASHIRSSDFNRSTVSIQNFLFFELDISQIEILWNYYYIELENSALLIFSCTYADKLKLHCQFDDNISQEDLVEKLQMFMLQYYQKQILEHRYSEEAKQSDLQTLQTFDIKTIEDKIKRAFLEDKLFLLYVENNDFKANSIENNNFTKIVMDLLRNEDVNKLFTDLYVFHKENIKKISAEISAFDQVFPISLTNRTPTTLVLFKPNNEKELVFFQEFNYKKIKEPSDLLFALNDCQVQFSEKLDEIYESKIRDISKVIRYGDGSFSSQVDLANAVEEVKIQPSYKKKALILLLNNAEESMSSLDTCQLELKQYRHYHNFIHWNNQCNLNDKVLKYAINKYFANFQEEIDPTKGGVYIIESRDSEEKSELVLYKFMPDGGSLLKRTLETFFSRFVQNHDLTADLEIESIKRAHNQLGISNALVPLPNILSDTIKNGCFNNERQKCLLLSFYGRPTTTKSHYIASTFLKSLIDRNDVDFEIIVWDSCVNNETLQKIIHREFDMDQLTQCVKSQTDVVIFFVPIGKHLIFHSLINDFGKEIKLWTHLEEVRIFFCSEGSFNSNITLNGGATQFQQIMFEELGDRDYDAFVKEQREQLRQKILYSFYGQPKAISGYEDKQIIRVEPVLQKIIEKSCEFSENGETVLLRFLWACVVPLPHTKMAKAKEDSNYVPHEDFGTFPVFVIRKCFNSKNPCQIIVDSSARVYQSWNMFLSNNQYPKGLIIVPKKGKYACNWNGNVHLEVCATPATKIGPMVLQGFDIAATVGGISATLAMGAGIALPLIAAPAAVVAAPLAIVGAAVGGVVGIYSIVRSGMNLSDRAEHEQSMSITDSEARGAYLNIIGGSLGIVTAGASAALTAYARTGATIGNVNSRYARYCGKSLTLSMDGLSVVNLVVNGTVVINSSIDLYIQYSEDGQTNILSVLQMSTSILFFAHSVYNFQTANQIIRQAQFEQLQQIKDSLRSNRHRKTFDRVRKANFRNNGGNAQQANADVIKMMRNLDNVDEVMATLTRNTKLMSQKGIKYSAENGNLNFNGVNIDIAEFGAASKAVRMDMLSELPTVQNTISNKANIGASPSSNLSRGISAPTVLSALDVTLKLVSITTSSDTVYEKCKALLNEFKDFVRNLLISKMLVILPEVLSQEILKSSLMSLYPECEVYARILQMVIKFFKQPKIFDILENQVMFKVNRNDLRKILNTIDKIIMFSFLNVKNLIVTIVRYISDLIASLIVDRLDSANESSRNQNGLSTSRVKRICKNCGGESYA